MHLNVSSRRLPAFFVVLLALMFIPSAPSYAAVSPSDAREPHDFRAYGMDCRSCHQSIGVIQSGGLVKPVQAICYGCHKLEGASSHPVDFKPAFALPVDLPLDEKGMMTCSTCHDPHKSYKNNLTGKRTMFLRREGPPKAFCKACHSKG